VYGGEPQTKGVEMAMTMPFEVKNPQTQIRVGDKTNFGKGVVFGARCQEVTIGYGCFIGNDIYIDVDHLTIGDYTTIHHGSIIHGIKTSIGHNCWFGHYTIIDSLGGNTRIGNNVGVGAHSQLWSHMKFGDVLNGCRWNSSSSLQIDDDVWLVGHSIVGPIHAKEKSMLMTGGVAVKDMESNHIYAGTPAKDVSDRFGMQFENISHEEKCRRFAFLRSAFCTERALDENLFPMVEEFDGRATVTQFNLRNRTFRPIRSDAEHQFIKYMLYEKAKWLPVLG
jgi:acetyltransferase-like isoleucine patch superfamily enzyme